MEDSFQPCNRLLPCSMCSALLLHSHAFTLACLAHACETWRRQTDRRGGEGLEKERQGPLSLLSLLWRRALKKGEEEGRRMDPWD